MSTRVLAIVLIVVGLVATTAGLGLRVLLNDDEGHHDGRPELFALSASSGADTMSVTQFGSEPAVVVEIDRAGQPITDFDDVHGAPLHVFAASTELDWYVHVDPDVLPDGTSTPVGIAPGRTHRVVTQSAPARGPDFLQLGVDVEVDGDFVESAQNITDDDVWTDGELTIRREGFDFVLSEPFVGADHHGGPAFLTLFRAEDMAFVHGHATLADDDRFRFSLAVPGRGEYLAALEFLATADADEPVTALFRFEL